MMFYQCPLLVAVLMSLVAAAPAQTQGGIDPPASFNAMLSKYASSVDATLVGSTCTKDTIAVCRSWEALLNQERKEYIQAVKCLHDKETIADPEWSPGNRNRLDDFTYTHINQTNVMHANGWFLPWHRFFVWSYEQALREECGYQGYQPYWENARWSDDQTKSPLFDGSETSLGGDGAFVPGQEEHNTTTPGLPPPGIVTPVLVGTGGDCIVDGPLSEGFEINLGQVNVGTSPNTDTFGRDYNPRCIKRNFVPELSKSGLNWDRVMNLMNSETIDEFRPTLDAGDGLHVSVHFSLGGDVSDVFSSTSDPAFFFLYGQIDRLWSIWQGQDFASRKNALNGTRTIQNIPPSEEATLDDTLDIVYSGQIKVAEVMSTTDGPFCYRYE